jgi:predicted DNA-binding protein
VADPGGRGQKQDKKNKWYYDPTFSPSHFRQDFLLTRCIISVTLLRKGEIIMPTKNPRVNIVIEPPLYSTLHDLATREGVSMSTIARDLIREALNLREDVALAAFADTRMKTFNKEAALSHEDVWK